MSDAQQTPAGWYPDPENAANLRYWDGTAWTENRHPVEPAAAAVPTAPAAPQFAYQPTGGVTPAYGAAPAYGAYGAPVQQNVLALVGLILAIVGTALGLLFSFFILVGIAGAIISIVGLLQANKMRAAGTPGDRRGMALAGVIVGFSGLLLVIIIAVITAIYFASIYSYY